MAKDKKPYSIVMYQGKELRQYEDGTLRDEKGIIRSAPSAVMRERVMHRYHMGKEAVAKALQDYYSAETPEEAYYKLAMRKIEIAANDNTRVGNEAFRMIGKAAGFIDDGTMARREDQRLPEVKFELPKEFQDALKEVLKDYGQVIDAEVEDADEE